MRIMVYATAALLFCGAACAKESGIVSNVARSGGATAQKAYARKVAAEIRRHSPATTSLHGNVSVRFTIGASGRVVSHTVVGASDPALSSQVNKILASVQAPPPPGGSFSANQLFVFH
ncbi:MAG: TonB C-terminal domain-containing protein [Methylocystis sp.]